MKRRALWTASALDVRQAALGKPEGGCVMASSALAGRSPLIFVLEGPPTIIVSQITGCLRLECTDGLQHCVGACVESMLHQILIRFAENFPRA
jgi:hypothetical protein